jgi:predicted nucleotidyltransferase
MVNALGEVLSGDEAGFMPSVYPIKIKYINSNIDPQKITRVISFVEEFRLQIQSGETALIKGNLERVVTKNKEFYQITLSYSNNYFNQVIKPIKTDSLNL